jgi:tRNA A-37 threonylcarbamoyl transferase component Bud32
MLVGQKLGPYAIDKELGSGAMGTVFRGKHQQTGERVAIKLMSPSLGTNDTALQRFKRETDIIKQLDHPNIVRLVVSGRIGKNPFYAMEYVEGESLDRALARRGRYSWEEVVRIAIQLCEALYHAHQMGIVHRDLKPSNLMIMKDGTVKLMDFGIAKDLDQTALTETNRTVGTAAYMSPEQCRGDKTITAKSDLYSLGVMLYELLTGKKPFVAESAMEMFIKHTKGKFERPARLSLDIPIWLDTLVCQLLEKIPDDRPFDAMVVHHALTKIREKVETQQSAGIERAKARRIDRTDLQPALDKTDLEAARTLLHKKKRKVPFYRKTWFMVVGLIGMAVLAGYVFYTIVIKAPAAESLLRDIDVAMKSDETEVREGMLKSDSALANFLHYHPDHARVPEVRQWRDDVLAAQCERQMYNRRRNKWKEEEGEKLARLALDDEDLGRLKEARKHWEELTAYKDKPDDGDRAWGLVALKFLRLHDDAKKLENELLLRSRSKQAIEKEPEPEQLVIQALRSEDKQKNGEALEWWEKTKKVVDAESRQRTYYLIAADHVRELKRK